MHLMESYACIVIISGSVLPLNMIPGIDKIFNIEILIYEGADTFKVDLQPKASFHSLLSGHYFESITSLETRPNADAAKASHVLQVCLSRHSNLFDGSYLFLVHPDAKVLNRDIFSFRSYNDGSLRRCFVEQVI